MISKNYGSTADAIEAFRADGWTIAYGGEENFIASKRPDHIEYTEGDIKVTSNGGVLKGKLPKDLADKMMNNTAKGMKIIEKCREIVKNQQFEKVNGMLVDMRTASVIVQVFDAIESEETRNKFLSFSVDKMAGVAYDVLKK